MINFKRPMLAASLLPPSVEHTDSNILAAMEKLHYPVLATLKKDGIRAIKLNDLVSRTLKLIPNKSIRARAMKLPAGFDMELWNPELAYDEVESIVMSREHARSDEIQFHVLDWYGAMPYYINRCERIDMVMYKLIYECDVLDVVFHMACLIPDAITLMHFFKITEEQDGEGICFRTPNSPYKQGRSTLKEQYLVKLARYTRQEVTIIGFEEQMENGNAIQHNAIGMMDRSSCKDSMAGKDTLGSFLVRDLVSGLTFNVGTGVGLTDKLRKEIWMNRDKYVDKQITIKFKGHGMKIKPRHPIFVGFRKEGF